MPRKSMADKPVKICKKIPASEYGYGQICKTVSGKEYRITQNPDKKKHTLWRVLSNGYEKISVASTPYDLYPLVDWEK